MGILFRSDLHLLFGKCSNQLRLFCSLLLQGKLSENDLTVDEISVLEKHFEKDIAASIVEPWQPWWLSEEAADLQLGASGMRLIQQSKADSELRNSDPRACEPTADSILSIPEPPTAPLPSLSSLTSKAPPPVISLHLLDILFSYCLVLRLFNGQYSADPVDAMATVFNASQIICPPGENILWEEMSIHEALVHIIARVTSPSAGRASVLHGFAIGIVSDVSRMLQLGRSIVIVALMDMSRLVNAAKQASQQHVCGSDKELQTTLRQAQRKLLFFMSWANELLPQVFEALATQVEVFYAQQKTTMEITLTSRKPHKEELCHQG